MGQHCKFRLNDVLPKYKTEHRRGTHLIEWAIRAGGIEWDAGSCGSPMEHGSGSSSTASKGTAMRQRRGRGSACLHQLATGLAPPQARKRTPMATPPLSHQICPARACRRRYQLCPAWARRHRKQMRPTRACCRHNQMRPVRPWLADGGAQIGHHRHESTTDPAPAGRDAPVRPPRLGGI